jgi:hypothetical protein
MRVYVLRNENKCQNVLILCVCVCVCVCNSVSHLTFNKSVGYFVKKCPVHLTSVANEHICEPGCDRLAFYRLVLWKQRLH